MEGREYQLEIIQQNREYSAAAGIHARHPVASALEYIVHFFAPFLLGLACS